jgi:glycosyltransferase involved in cell wall biosynthesis
MLQVITMFILTNSLVEHADEGCVNVAKHLISLFKHKIKDTYIVTYDRKSDESDEHLCINRLLLSTKLFKIIRARKEKIFYFPFPAKAISTAVRIFVLSLYAKFGVNVVIVQKDKVGFIAKALLKMSGAEITVLSKDSYNYYSDIVGKKKVGYLKTGVDTGKFTPVSDEEKQKLRDKYGFENDRPLVLHVGHLNEGRNIRNLTEIDSSYQVVLVVSTLTMNERDESLRKELESCGNIRIIDHYIKDIQELYQLSDVYFFPVLEEGHCIDVPLSCLEAAACNKPVVMTGYGELSELKDFNGFYCIQSFDRSHVNELIASALNNENIETRKAVINYDWTRAVAFFSK